MPYWQRQRLLDDSLLAYAMYSDLEICIADDGSPLSVRAPGCKVAYLPKKLTALNPCIAINAAVALSTSDVIVLTNPEIKHIEPIFPQMLEQLKTLGDKGYVTASCMGEGGWLAHSSIKPLTNGRGAMPEGSQFHFCAMFYRQLWDDAGGFDEDYRQGQAFDDNDWLWRLEDAGAIFHHMDECVTTHTHTGTKWPAGGHQINNALHTKKWGHKWAQ